MKYGYIAAALVAALLCVASLAQDTSPSTQPSTPQTQAPTTPSPQTQPETRQTPTSPAAGENQSANKNKIAPGSVLPVQLTKTVDAKKAKTGDQVEAKVVADMKTQSGEVLVPKDTKVIGHVTEAQPRSKEQKESQLAIAFDRAEMKDGNSMQMPMSIQAIIGQQHNNANGGGGAPAPSSQGSAGVPAGAPGGSSSGNRQTGGMSGSASAPAPSPSATAGEGGEAQNGGSSMPQITTQTQGVIGISNLQLSSASGGQGSVMTSEKNNVKLESGTMLLLKVQ